MAQGAPVGSSAKNAGFIIRKITKYKPPFSDGKLNKMTNRNINRLTIRERLDMLKAEEMVKEARKHDLMGVFDKQMRNHLMKQNTSDVVIEGVTVGEPMAPKAPKETTKTKKDQWSDVDMEWFRGIMKNPNGVMYSSYLLMAHAMLLMQEGMSKNRAIALAQAIVTEQIKNVNDMWYWAHIAYSTMTHAGKAKHIAAMRIQGVVEVLLAITDQSLDTLDADDEETEEDCIEIEVHDITVKQWLTLCVFHELGRKGIGDLEKTALVLDLASQFEKVVAQGIDINSSFVEYVAEHRNISLNKAADIVVEQVNSKLSKVEDCLVQRWIAGFTE